MGSRGANPESAPPIGEGEAAAPPGGGVAVYLSSILGPPPRTSAALAGFLGFTDYSYSFSMQGYIDAFEALGLECALLNAVQNIGDVALVSAAPANLHFGFYPPDKPRLLKGAYNVFVMAWEFERLRLGHENQAHHAFADPVRTMNLADEVWMVSRFGADAAARSGVANVRAVASPVLKGVSNQARQAAPDAKTVFENAGRLDRVEWVPLAVAPIFQPVLTLEAGRRRRALGALLREMAGETAPIVFLTVFNIADWRKQVLPLLEAFVRFAAVHPNALLLLKLNSAKDQTTDLNFELLCQQIAISGELAPPLVSDRIWLTSEPLDREELDSLYDLAAFYVCTSHGEGQNLPLIEAMGRGVVALSVDHTAMADYLTSANAIVIPSTLGPFNARLRFRYAMSQISTYYVSAPEVQNALERAIALDPAAYASLSAAGLATVKGKFGLEPFRAAVEAAIARARAARFGLIGMAPRAWLEVGPMFERHWTGIAKVTAGLARHALADPDIDWAYFFQSLALPGDYVAKLLAQGSGAGGFDYLADLLWEKRDIPFDEARRARALFMNIKTLRGFFGDEAIFVHDLSTLLTPQFHNQDTIDFFADHIRYDIETSSRVFCNSLATRGDLIAYLGVAPAAVTAVPMGLDIDPADLGVALLAAERLAVEPYIAVLATLEPRKNAAIVLRFLARHPEFADRYRIVFIGRPGWLDEHQALLAQIEAAGLPSERIIFTGYVEESEKIALLFNAAFCVYASMFEGFGLPILEAAALGKIVVASNSSSMPEAAPDHCCFFDPTDDEAFAAAMAQAEGRAAAYSPPGSFADIARRLEPLGWDRAYRLVADWVTS